VSLAGFAGLAQAVLVAPAVQQKLHGMREKECATLVQPDPAQPCYGDAGGSAFVVDGATYYLAGVLYEVP